ncbi:MAG: hypothetical protein E7629_04815 [Ruminococcaceae bacterium]|nr:hypothetical protein [Oscillospiraceae bacterium]
MKKRILAVLLSALILANVTACNVAPENELESTSESIEIEDQTINTTEQEHDSTTETTNTPQATEEDPPLESTPKLTLSEYQKLVGCYVTTESGKNLENLMRKRAEQIKVSHEGYGSNVFHIQTVHNDTEYQTTIQLSEGVRTPDIYCGFIGKQNGYVMIFHMEDYSVSPMDDIELACVLKTADGGKTWDKIEYNDFRVSNGREYISAACFFTEKVGFFTARYTNTDHFGPRTYWTVDGGQTWTSMPRLDIPNMLKPFGLPADFASEISDVTTIEGVYTLTVRICYGYSLNFDIGNYIPLYIQYASTDLENWELVKQQEEPIREGSLDCNGKYFSGSEVTYTVDQNNHFTIHIADWKEDHLLTSFSYQDIQTSKYSARAIGVNSERAFFLLHKYYENKITVVSFEKGSPNESVVTLDVDDDLYRICGNFVNETVGYLFAFKETMEGGHSRGGSKLSNLFKTEDGGRTWTSVDVQNVPVTDLREPVVYAKMINEDVGLIYGHIFASDYNFCERTLLTTDGGINWFYISDLPLIEDHCLVEVIDFIQDKDYILTVRYLNSENNYEYLKYVSSNLKSWFILQEIG